MLSQEQPDITTHQSIKKKEYSAVAPEPEEDDTGVYREIAANYDLWYQNPRGAFIDELETEAALKLFSPYPNQPVLDAGCGTNFSIKLAQMGSKVTDIDISGRHAVFGQETNFPFKSGYPIPKNGPSFLDFPDGSFAGYSPWPPGSS